MGSIPVDIELRRPEKGIGKEKTKVRRRQGGSNYGAIVEDCDVVLRSRCTLKKLVAVNVRITAMQRAAVEVNVLRPCIDYRDTGMERH